MYSEPLAPTPYGAIIIVDGGRMVWRSGVDLLLEVIQRPITQCYGQ